MLKVYIVFCEVNRGADCVIVKATGRGFEEMKYLFKFILPFLRCGFKAKRGFKFRHSTRYFSRDRWKNWERSVLKLGLLYLP